MSDNPEWCEMCKGYHVGGESHLTASNNSSSITYEQYQACLKEADERMKANNGHQYLHILKTRCMNCGRSPKVKTRCSGWFNTFVNILGHVLQEKGIINEIKETEVG